MGPLPVGTGHGGPELSQAAEAKDVAFRLAVGPVLGHNGKKDELTTLASYTAQVKTTFF